MLDRIVPREGIGDVLANGTYWAAKQIGKGADAYAHNTIKKHEQLPLKLGMLNPIYFLMYSTGEKMNITQIEGNFPQAPFSTMELKQEFVKDWVQAPNDKFKRYVLDWEFRGERSMPFYPPVEACCEIVDWQEKMHHLDDALRSCAGLSSFPLKPPYHIHNLPTFISGGWIESEPVTGASGSSRKLLNRSSAGSVCVSWSYDTESGGDPMGPLRGTSSCSSGKGEEARDHGLLCRLVRALGQGGVSLVSRACGLSRKAITKGQWEIEGGTVPPLGRTRRPGGGRKNILDHDPRLLGALAKGTPVISVDTKKKELVGKYENGGRQWLPAKQPVKVNGHDFPHPRLPSMVLVLTALICSNPLLTNFLNSADWERISVSLWFPCKTITL